jgi:hypothetical protein
MPLAITAAGGIYALKDKITTPDTLTAHFEFDRVPIVWRHHIWGAEEYQPQCFVLALTALPLAAALGQDAGG